MSGRQESLDHLRTAFAEDPGAGLGEAPLLLLHHPDHDTHPLHVRAELEKLLRSSLKLVLVIGNFM